MISRILSVLMVMLFSVTAFAQEAAAEGAGFMAMLQSLIDKIPSDGAFVMICAALIEFVLRMVKTEKPKSIMYMISDVMKLLAAGLQKLAMLMDKVLPQRLK